jgi:hypothetical protein
MRVLLIFIMSLFSVCAFADITITERSSDGEIVSYYSGNKMAYFVDGQVTNITDVNAGMIYVINSAKKTYFQKSFAEMEEIAKQAAEQFKSIRENPQYKDFMKAVPAGKVNVEKVGSRKIAGYSCDEYTVKLSMSPMSVRLCLSKDVEALVSKEINSKKIEKLMAGFGTEGDDSPMGKALEGLKDKNGFPMLEKSESSIPGMDSEATEVISVSNAKISPVVYKLPQGYKKVTMEELMGDEY